MIKICNICGGDVKMFNPSEIYGSGFKHFNDSKEKSGKCVGFVYKCLKCSATVGCHEDSNKPYGTLANKETKNARHLVHKLLDPLWKIKQKGNYKTGLQGKERKRLYKLLSEHMNIPFEKTHMGMFNIEQCRIAYKFFLKYKQKNKYETK